MYLFLHCVLCFYAALFFNFAVSRASQVGLHKQKKDSASSRKGKVRYSRLCSRSNGARLGLGRLKYV